MGAWFPTQFSDTDDQTGGNGIHFNVLTSPYNIPEAVRGYRREQDGRFVIEFRYIDDGEPVETRLLKSTPDISVRIGKKSDRLYAIECDIDAMNVNTVSVQLLLPKVEETFQSLLAKPEEFPEKSNYESARKVVQDRLERLFGVSGAAANG